MEEMETALLKGIKTNLVFCSLTFGNQANWRGGHSLVKDDLHAVEENLLIGQGNTSRGSIPGERMANRSKTLTFYESLHWKSLWLIDVKTSRTLRVDILSWILRIYLLNFHGR